MDGQNFVTDAQTLRKRARQHIDERAVTSDYGAERATVLKLLNDSLATEVVCVLRYRRAKRSSERNRPCHRRNFAVRVAFSRGTP